MTTLTGIATLEATETRTSSGVPLKSGGFPRLIKRKKNEE